MWRGPALSGVYGVMHESYAHMRHKWLKKIGRPRGSSTLALGSSVLLEVYTCMLQVVCHLYYLNAVNFILKLGESPTLPGEGCARPVEPLVTSAPTHYYNPYQTGPQPLL